MQKILITGGAGSIGSELTRSVGDDELLEGYSIAYEELLITNALKEHDERMRESRPKPL